MNKTSEDVQQMIAQADKDENGSIELNEFMELVASIMGKTNETEVNNSLTVKLRIINLLLRFLLHRQESHSQMKERSRSDQCSFTWISMAMDL